MINPKDVITDWCTEYKIHIIKYPKNMSRDLGLFQCSCGAKYEAKANYVVRRVGCPACVKLNSRKQLSEYLTGRPSKKKFTNKVFVEKLKKLQPTIKCLDEYTGYGYLRFKCLVCKTERIRYVGNAFKFGCGTCAGNIPKTTESYNKELESFGIPFVCKNYAMSRTPTKHTCTRCKIYTVMASPTNMLKRDKIMCPLCDSSTVYSLKVGARVFRIRGYERFVLPKLLKSYSVDDIFEDLSGQVPSISLATGSTHKPDFYIPSRNLLIEVKSIGTLGLRNVSMLGKGAFSKTKRKKEAAVKAGYKYTLALMTDKGTRIPLPSNWESYTLSALKKHISSLGFKC